MTYQELIDYVNQVIADGKPLHGLAREIAIDMALNKEDAEK